MATDVQPQPAADFQALPLEFIVAAPLKAAINAQAIAAATTKTFLESMLTDNKPQTVDFTAQLVQTIDPVTKAAKNQAMSIKVPLLSIVPIPHLRIDSVTTHFLYSITQTITSKEARDYAANLEVKGSGLLSGLLGVSLSGSVASKSAQESTTNRSGTLEITVHASEAPMPEGLSKLLDLMSKAVLATPVP
jgi:hypothetical protein